MDNDTEIRVLLSQGDVSALALIHQHYGGLLHALLLGYLGHPQEADDAFQDLFVTISQQHTKLAQAKDVGAYLTTMARNLALMALRRRKRHHLDHEPVAELFSSNPAMVDGESAAAVSAAVMSLPLEQREVMVLKIWHDRTFADIAVLLGIPPNTAASRYRYGSEKLRTLLKAWQ